MGNKVRCNDNETVDIQQPKKSNSRLAFLHNNERNEQQQATRPITTKNENNNKQKTTRKPTKPNASSGVNIPVSKGYMALNWSENQVVQLMDMLIEQKQLEPQDVKMFVQYLREMLFFEKRKWFYEKLTKSCAKYKLNDVVSNSGIDHEALRKKNLQSMQDDVLFSDFTLDMAKFSNNVLLDVEYGKTEALIENYERFKKRLINPEAIYAYYFELPDKELVEEDLHPANTNLPLFLIWNIDLLALQGCSKTQILQVLNNQIKRLHQTAWVFRLVLATLSDKDKKENYTMFDYFRLAGLSVVGTTYGLNHAALQIGPYYIHYTTSNIVTFHDVEHKSNAFVMMYPHDRFELTYTKENFLALCEVIVDYNKGELYDDLRHNCHHFVEAVFGAIKCPPFPEKGPIANFLDLVKKSNSGVNHMRIKDLDGKIVEFKDHAHLISYCQQASIKTLLDSSPSELSDYQYQFLEVLKAVERGFQIQLHHNKQLVNDDLVFPQSEVVSLIHNDVDKITKYKPLN